MSEEVARAAAVEAALEMVQPQTTIGLGSGRAVFALCDAIGHKWNGEPPVKAVAASDATAQRARAAGISVVNLERTTRLAVAYDGADEIDPDFNLIKGAGAALLREKLLMAAADRVVIMAEEKKLVERLGTTKRLPVEVVRFGWEQTAVRLAAITGEGELRMNQSQLLVTDEGNYIIDAPIPAGADLATIDREIKGTLGVVDHGLFLANADTLLAGQTDGSLRTLTR